MPVTTLLRGNRNLIKAMNRNLLLNIIRREGKISRTQLTERSGLSVGAVSQITGDLIEKHWVLEVGEGEYTGGRRQTLLRLNPKAGYAIGVKLMERHAICAVTDFEARIVHYQDHPLLCVERGDDSPRAIADELAQFIQWAIEQAGLARSACLGVGIGLAGVIDPHARVVHYSPFFGWHDAPLAQLVEAQLRLPVYVENDVNTLTLSEMLFGSGRQYAHFVVITVGRGIGMGMVLHGQLYHGMGGAGELGHIVLDLALARGSSDEVGTLEALAADPAVIRTVQQARGENYPTTLPEVIALAEQGDPAAQAALARSGELLGVGLANVINVLAPQLVIISGEGVAAREHRLQPMFEAMRRYAFNGLLDGVEIIIEPTDERAWARGAASLVISKVFESPLLEAQAYG